jgi:hypothetical protein
MMPLRPLLKNKLLLQKNYNVSELSMDYWPFWVFEENISIINEIHEEEERQRGESESNNRPEMPNFNPSSYMSQMSNIASSFKP